MNWNRKISQDHPWNAADTVTVLRMAFSLFLLLLPLGSGSFLAVYTLAGLTDVLDGWLARKMGTASRFGARLDSIADLLFYGVSLLRLFPLLWWTLPQPIWYAVGGIVLVRLMSYAIAAFQYHRFTALHTWLNKLTGGAVFLIPYVMAVTSGVGYCWTVCILAFAASLEELAIHLCREDSHADIKSILQVGVLRQ